MVAGVLADFHCLVVSPSGAALLPSAVVRHVSKAATPAANYRALCVPAFFAYQYMNAVAPA